jgi:hypothetical protein
MGPLTPCAIFFLSRSCPDWACSSTNPSGEGAFLRRSDLLFCVSRSTCPAGPLLFQQAGCTFHSLNPPDEGPPRGGGRQFCFTFWASVASKTPGVLGCFECRCLQRRGVYPSPFLRLSWYLCLFLQLYRRYHRFLWSPFEIAMPLSFRTCGGFFVDLFTRLQFTVASCYWVQCGCPSLGISWVLWCQ